MSGYQAGISPSATAHAATEGIFRGKRLHVAFDSYLLTISVSWLRLPLESKISEDAPIMKQDFIIIIKTAFSRVGRA